MKRALPPLLLAVLAIPLAARADTTQSDFVLVRNGEVVTEDLIAAGNSIQVDGTIDGDLVAAAFDRISINGVVTGDVVVVSGRLEINGTVGGSVRAATGTLIVEGEIADDLAVTAWTITTEPSSDIGRDVLVFGRNATIAGRVGRDVIGQFSTLVLNADIDGSAEVNVGRLTIGPATKVGDEIGYRSRNEAVIEAPDTGGAVIHRTPLRPNIRITALIYLTFALVGLLLLAGGLVATHYWPERIEQAVAVAGRPLAAWLAGIGVAASPLLVLGVFAAFLALFPAAAGIPLAVLFVPVALGLGGLALLGAITGIVPVAGAIGRRLRERTSLPGAVLVGMLVLAVIALVPYLRWAIFLLGLPIGLGSWLGRETSA